MWNAVVDHTLGSDFDQFVGGPYFKSTISATSKPYGGQYTAMVFEAPNTQMTQFPRRIANDLGEILQAITGKALGKGASGNDEGSMRIINSLASI